MDRFAHYFAKRTKCQPCDGVGRTLPPGMEYIKELPRNDPRQPGTNCQHCYGRGFKTEYPPATPTSAPSGCG